MINSGLRAELRNYYKRIDELDATRTIMPATDEETMS
jgi:hypothetical protein